MTKIDENFEKLHRSSLSPSRHVSNGKCDYNKRPIHTEPFRVIRSRFVSQLMY